MQRSHSTFWAFVSTIVLVLGARTSPAAPVGSHPYFPDGGTLTWFTEAAEAQAAARLTGKLVFVEYGRKACGNCRTLVSKYLPCALLRDRFSDLCVGLASDCDEADPRVESVLKAGLPNACTLPFAAFLTPDLLWVTGWAGSTTPCDISAQLTIAETARAKAAVARAEAARVPRGQAPDATPARAPAALASTRPLTGRSTPAADVEKARALLVRARAASAAERHGEVLRLDVEAGRLSVRVEPAAWAALGQQALAWAEARLAAATVAARARRCDEASKTLADVKREMTGRAAESEASRGERAVLRLKAVDAAPEGGRVALLEAAAKEFVGSRWAALFES